MASFSAPVLSATSGPVRAARKLARRASRAQQQLFLAEGWKSLQAAGTLPGNVVEVFATQTAAAEYADLLAPHRVHRVDSRAMSLLSDSVTPAGLVAVCRTLDVPMTELIARGLSSIAVCADVRDPGNAGTLIRTADAFGVGAVVLAGHSVDAFNPKTVRATVGSLWHLPICVASDPVQTVVGLQSAGFTVLAADGAGSQTLGDQAVATAVTGRHAWLFGNEAWGLPEQLAQAADLVVRIPITGQAESLNLSTAAAVCLWESARR